jgi:hypothetical protein
VNDFDRDAMGAAFFEVGLVPDFQVFRDAVRAPVRLRRNMDAVRALTWGSGSDRARVLALRLSDKDLRSRLAAFVSEAGLEDPRSWTRRIALEREHWPLAFHNWRFEDELPHPDAIYVCVTGLGLPTVGEGQGDPRLSLLVGQHYLPVGQKGLKDFTLSFKTSPVPAKVQGLTRFALQVISQETGPVGLVKHVGAWKTARAETTVKFTKLKKVAWEAGWHFVRVVPLTEQDDPVPLLDEHGDPLASRSEDSAERPPNESDLFYVLPDGEIDEPSSQRAVPKDASVMHAFRRLQFAAISDGRASSEVHIKEVLWKDARARTPLEVIEAKFGRDGTVHIPLSRQLKELEQRILAVPDGPLGWRLSLSQGNAGVGVAEAGEWPGGPTAGEFLQARRAYFERLRNGGVSLVTQGSDLTLAKSEVCAYAETYERLLVELLQRAESGRDEGLQVLAHLRHLLALDTITLDITDFRGRRREAVLLGPTHPLRALWLGVWAELGERWLAAAKAGAAEHIIPTRDALLRTLVPLNVPPFVAHGAGRIFAAVDNLNPFWTLYAASNEEDPRGLLGDVCAALGLSEPDIGGALITGSYLAHRVERYLIQHPYVQTLAINAFNPGRAGMLADMLLELQERDVFANLRYDLRLFVPDPEAPLVGEGLADLLSPTATVTSPEADAFVTPGASHLFPKLALAVKSTAEFLEDPNSHAAHLSFLFDVFPASQVAAVRSECDVESPSIYGLIQNFETAYFEDETMVAWHRQPAHGKSLELAGAEELTDLLSSLPAAISTATAAVSTGQAGPSLRPRVSLVLEGRERNLIHHVHEVSDWVITIDRQMGIEFYDHGGRPGRPDYLIDHSPDLSSAHGHRVVITSRSFTELESMLQPALAQFKLPVDRRHAVAVLDQVRALSGRLALKLVSSPNQRAEVIGLALARLYLDYQGVFRNQIVVPLDAHLELYHELLRQADELGDAVSFKRTDLAVFELDPNRDVVTCRLVEVKCYSDVGGLQAYQALKDRVKEQLAQSEQVLAQHFDPHRAAKERPDRLIKTYELSVLLRFYLERAERYRLLDVKAAAMARRALRQLEAGYRLVFTRSGLIFDFERPGTEPAELESGVEFHRIGRNLIEELLEAALPAIVPPPTESTPTPSQPSTPERDRHPASLSSATLETVPRLKDAAFIATAREGYSREREPEAPRTIEGEPQPAEPTNETPEPGIADDQIARELRRDSEGVIQSPSNAVIDSDGATPPRQASTDASTPAKLAAESPKIADEVQATSQVPSIDVVSAARYDLVLGTTGATPQFGILGETSGRRVAIDLNETHTISLFGVQGGGKSYTLGLLAEMATMPIAGINLLPRPLATVIFHYSPTQDYAPEYTSMAIPNQDVVQSEVLRGQFGVAPQGLDDVIVLAPADKLEARRIEFPHLDVRPLKFASSELQASHWRFLMGAVGNQSTYIRQLNHVMRDLRQKLTLDAIKHGIDTSRMADHLKDLARQRLELASLYIDDAAQLRSLVRPGRMLIVDLRDEFIEKDEALGLFVVLLQLVSEARFDGQPFNKLVVFDEAHKYIDSPDLVAGLIETVREMRHKGTSVLLASQDPPSVPVSVIELSTQIILHRFNSPAWLKHIQKANAALLGLTPERMAHLAPGEAYVWSSKATDDAFSRNATRVRCRPRVTQHGGATKTAVR